MGYPSAQVVADSDMARYHRTEQDIITNKFVKVFININSLIWNAINIYFALKYL